jgi:hypothetical protein
LLEHGLIFSQPLTRTTSYVKEVAQPQAVYAAIDGIGIAAKENGLKVDEIAQAKGKSVEHIAEAVVERSRSDVNAGAFAFSEQIRPLTTLRSAYAESAALANEIGLGERQLHHLVTKDMVKLLKVSQPQIKPQEMRDNPDLQKMSAPGGHIGYEKWHRHYDATMAAFISFFPPGKMLPEDLILEMHNYYQSDHGFDITKRIPDVKLI